MNYSVKTKAVFEKLIGKQVSRVFIILWPPYGEVVRSNIDISVGICLHGLDEMIVITTDKNDACTPLIMHQAIAENIYSCDIFEDRVLKWQNCLFTTDIIPEYYEFSNSDLFVNITDHTINDVELIYLNDNFLFGVRLIFDNDIILSTAISDGNTIETNKFRLFDSMPIYSILGTVNYQSLKKAI